MTGVSTKHPEYTDARRAEWRLMRDAVDGESAIKAAGETYLTKPNGFTSQSDQGKAAYEAYKSRAQFPELLAPSLAAMVGAIHEKEIQIEMPDGLAFLNERATADGLSLEAFHRRITRNLLLLGRYAVLADAPSGGGDPFLAGYAAPAVINWDQDFFVLDECHMARNGFAWEKVDQYRVLGLNDGRYVQIVHRDGGEEDVTPTIRGGAALDRVPFAVANAKDLASDIETPPLIGVARAALAIYQLTADYRYQLFMSGQETLVAINGEAPDAIGAGVVHQMMGSEGVEPDLKYVSPTCAGIDAHKNAMQDNREAAAMAGARLLHQESRAQESGEARRLRNKSETATLLSVAQASCALLETSLRNAAAMIGLPEDEIVVTPPADLLDNTMSPADALALMQVWQSGGVSYQTYYENLQRGGIASAERDHEEETSLIDGEDVLTDLGETP